MPQSLNYLLVHVIFSTKDRAPVLHESIRPELHAHLATVTHNAGCECFRVGSVADHVHLAIRLSRTANVADLVETLKTSSSRWLKSQSPSLSHFAWQRGYVAFSVSPSDALVLMKYINEQARHHKKRSFQDELRAFLMKYGVEFDERHVWD